MTQDSNRKKIYELSNHYKGKTIDRDTFYNALLPLASSFVAPIANLDIMTRMREYQVDEDIDTVLPDALNRAIDAIDNGSKDSLFVLVPQMHYPALSDLINRKIAQLYFIDDNQECTTKYPEQIMCYMEALQKGYRGSKGVLKNTGLLCGMHRQEDVVECYQDTVITCINKYDTRRGVPFLGYFDWKYTRTLCDLKSRIFSEGQPTLVVKEPNGVPVYATADIGGAVLGMLPVGKRRRVYSIRNNENGTMQFYHIRYADRQHGFVQINHDQVLYQDQNFAHTSQITNTSPISAESGESQEKTMLAVYCTAFRKQNRTTSKIGTLTKRRLNQQFASEVVLDTLHAAEKVFSQVFKHEKMIMATIDQDWMNYLLSAPCNSFRDIILTPRKTCSYFAQIASRMVADYKEHLPQEALQEKNIREELHSYENYSGNHAIHNSEEVDVHWCEIAVRLPFLRNELQIKNTFGSVKTQISQAQEPFESFFDTCLQLDPNTLKDNAHLILETRGDTKP